MYLLIGETINFKLLNLGNIMINSYAAESNNKIRGIKNKYHSSGNKKVKISNNTKAINVVSSLSQQDIDRDSIKSIDFGNNVVELDENCLSGCRNLQYVGGTKINKVGDRSFYDCTSLTSIEFFNKGTKTNLSEIGERAFSNTGLVNAYIKPDQNANTKLEPYIFADCKNLKYVETIQFNTLGDYQFQNCTALETVKMANSHGYMGKYAFQNCSNLKNITIPAVTWGLGEGMFCDCSSLTSIEFNEPSELNLRHCFNNFFLSGTSISSITFPRSVTEPTCFDEFALYGMEKLNEIHFDGMSMDKIVNMEESGTPTQIPLYTWSIASDVKVQFITENYEKSQMTGDEFERLARMNNVALFTFFTTTSTVKKTKEACSDMGNYFSMESFKLWMRNLKKPIAFLERNYGSGNPYYTFSYYSTEAREYIKSGKLNGKYQFSDLTQDQREQTLKTIISEIIEPNIKNYIDQEGEPPVIDYEQKYPFNTLIGNFEQHLPAGSPMPTLYYNTKNQTDKDFFGNLFSYARSRHVPIIVFETGSACSRCPGVIEKVRTNEFKKYLDNLGDKKLLIVDSCNTYNGSQSPLSNRLTQIQSKHGVSGGYVYFFGEYSDRNNTIHTTAKQFTSTTTSELTSIINSWLKNEFSSYENPLSDDFQLQIINNNIQSTNCFGVNHKIKIFSNDGKSITFDPIGESYPPEFKYVQMQVIDNRTVNDFKYGQWYGNAKELKEFADKNHVPVMVEIGSEGCPPCNDFNSNIFQDSDFQQYVQNDVPILLCKVEGIDGNTNTQFIFAYESWCNQSDNDFPTGKMPLMLFYWNQGNGSIKKKYVPYQKGSDPDDLRSIDEIENEISNFIRGYQGSTEFYKPHIDKTELSGYPRYIKYVTSEQDDYGKYIPVVNLNYQGEIKLSVKNSDNVLTEYTINQGQKDSIPPIGTYQYFTLPLSTENYDIQYQREGVIFRVGSGGQEKLTELNKYQYGFKQISTYENETSLSDYEPSIINNFSIYEEGTTKINSELEKDQIYNLVYTYNLSQPIKKGETNYHKVKIYLSAEVSCNPDLTYDIIGERYVLTADWYYYIDNDVQVQWLSAFDNYSK